VVERGYGMVVGAVTDRRLPVSTLVLAWVAGSVLVGVAAVPGGFLLAGAVGAAFPFASDRLAVVLVLALAVGGGQLLRWTLRPLVHRVR
jgi:hypothetical protein